MNKRHTAEFLAAAVAIATGTPAYAEVIIFINPDPGEPGHFDWTMVGEDQFANQDINNSGDASVWLAHLDITRPSTDQVGFVGVGQIFRFTGGFPEGWTAKNYNLPQPDEYQPFALARIGASTRTRSLLAGASIGGQLDFIAGSIHASCSDYGGANCGSAFQAGVPSYMGVRFSFDSASSDTPTSYHYGWVGVVRVGTYDLDAFAWGYETEPGVPIVACDTEAPPCVWDCGGDNDNNVGIVDFLALLAQWGGQGSCDFDGCGVVGIADLLNLLAHWGRCP